MFFRQLSRRRTGDSVYTEKEMKELEQESKVQEEEETISDCLSKCISKKPQQKYTLTEIKQMVCENDWGDWWEYNKDIWELSGWIEDKESTPAIFAEDITEIISNAGPLVTSDQYRAIINFHLKNANKIGKNNSFLPCEGYSVVGKVELNDAWKKLSQQLESVPEIFEYFTLLPVDSWHITIAGLSDIELQGIFEYFSQREIRYIFKIREIYTQGVLLLAVELDQADKQLLVDACTSLEIKDSMPSDFHISLGYQNQPLPIKKSKIIKDKVGEMLDKLDLKNTEQSMCSPQVYAYESMAKFILLEEADVLKSRKKMSRGHR